MGRRKQKKAAAKAEQERRAAHEEARACTAFQALTPPAVVLYSYWRSSSAWRVRLALNYKRIAHDLIPVNLLKGEHMAPAYRAVNAHAVLPALRIDGLVLAESLAVLEYLEETRPEPAMLPRDAAGKAVVRRLALMVVADIQPVQNLKVLKYVGDEKKAEWAKHWITDGFVALESVLATCPGPHAYGDTPTLADFCIVPQVYNALRYNVDLAPFPNIRRVAAALEVLPFAVQAHPDQQPDAVK